MKARAEDDSGMSLSSSVRENGNVVVLDLKGRITLGEGSSLLRDQIREMLDSGHRNIVLNLAGVTYIDSAGLGQMVGSFATIAHRGGHLKLLNMSKRVAELMHITKLHAVFESFTNEQAAIRSFADAAHS